MVSIHSFRGLAETLKIGSFRYNQLLQDYEINRFLHDLFNNPNVRFVMNNVRLTKCRSNSPNNLSQQSNSRE